MIFLPNEIGKAEKVQKIRKFTKCINIADIQHRFLIRR